MRSLATLPDIYCYCSSRCTCQRSERDSTVTEYGAYFEEALRLALAFELVICHRFADSANRRVEEDGCAHGIAVILIAPPYAIYR